MGGGLKWVIILPIFNFFAALALFLTLLLLWVTSGAPRYKSNEASVVYISDVGKFTNLSYSPLVFIKLSLSIPGAVNKPLFIGLGTVIGVLFVATLSLDYYLRRQKILPPMGNKKKEKPLAIFSILFGFIAALGLILLTIFDAFNHSTLHWTFALIFFVGLAISGILNVTEINRLHKDHPKSKLLKWSHRVKLVIIVLAVISLIAMIVLMAVSMAKSVTKVTRRTATDRPLLPFQVCGTSKNMYDAQGNLSNTCNIEDSLSAVFEWCIAFLFSFYLATLIMDMWPYRSNSDDTLHDLPNGNMSQAPSTV